jgi:NAD(P)H-hydrate repair Nnr-like enzyme with NAD(P)H-hydrate dehydratase domain
LSDPLQAMLIRQWELAEQLAAEVEQSYATVLYGPGTGPLAEGARAVKKALKKKIEAMRAQS